MKVESAVVCCGQRLCPRVCPLCLEEVIVMINVLTCVMRNVHNKVCSCAPPTSPCCDSRSCQARPVTSAWLEWSRRHGRAAAPLKCQVTR